MALNIGKKVYRTLQEQVGYNSERIEQIADYIDGLDVQDSVIVLDSLSPLNSEQMKVAEQPLAFIVYDEAIYLKTKEDATYFYFERMMKMELGTYITLSSAVIVVTKLNGATGITVSSVNVYSKSQIDTSLGLKADVTYVDTELAKKADLSGATFTGAVKAPTLEQSQANYTASLNASIPENTELDPNSFLAVKVVNGILHLVYEARISNPTGDDIVGNVGISSTYIDENYSKKIYRKDGTACNVNYTSWPTICNYEVITQVQAAGTRNVTAGILSSYSANRISGYIPNITIPAGKFVDVSFRFSLILV